MASVASATAIHWIPELIPTINWIITAVWLFATLYVTINATEYVPHYVKRAVINTSRHIYRRINAKYNMALFTITRKITPYAGYVNGLMAYSAYIRTQYERLEVRALGTYQEQFHALMVDQQYHVIERFLIAHHNQIDINYIYPANNVINNNTDTAPALIVAIQRSDYHLCHVLLYRGADPNILYNNHTPLNWAAVAGYLRRNNNDEARMIFNMLLEHGANIERAINCNGTAILHHVLYAPHMPHIIRCIEMGVDVNAPSNHHRSALHAMLCGIDNATGWINVKNICELLMRHGADPTIPDQEGRTAIERVPMHMAELATLMRGAGSYIKPHRS